MGLFKKIKKAVKKTVNKLTKPVKKVAGKGLAGILKSRQKPVKYAVDSGVVATAGPAQVVEPPDKDIVDTENDATTESGKKKTRAGGKKSLSVSRNSGGGLNI